MNKTLFVWPLPLSIMTNEGLIQTSPIPEDALVISTTLPDTFSLYMDLFKDQRNLRIRNGGMKKSNTMRVKGRSTMFKNL